MRFKQVIVLVLTAACLCTSFETTVFAETVSAHLPVNSLSPLYDFAENVYSDVNVIGTEAKCTSQGNGTNTIKITVEQTLQKYSGWFWIWNAVDGATWSKTVNSSIVSFTNTKSNLSSGKYRLKSVFTLTDKNGKTETITVYSDEVSIG